MKLMTTTCIATLGAIAAGPIWAEATDAGAAELLSVFQTYLGTTEGVVSVAVAGDDYAVTLDPGAMMAALPLEGLAFTVSPIEMTSLRGLATEIRFTFFFLKVSGASENFIVTFCGSSSITELGRGEKEVIFE